MTEETVKKPRLLFLVTEDWYFYSHRLPMVRAAQNAGFDVAVITNVDQHQAAIEEQGVQVIPLSLERRSLNPLKALKHIKDIVSIYRREKPALVHHIAMKPILYGSIAARFARVPHVVNAFAGLGYVFHSQERTARLIRPVLIMMFAFLLKGQGRWLLFQNRDDLAHLKKYNLVDEAHTALIRGSGVDIDAFPAMALPPGDDFICAFAGRMIGIKGLPTLKEAFAILAQTAPHVKLWLCGQPDPANPGSWTTAELQDWGAESDNVIYKGQCQNMSDLWRQVHVAIQVSYGGEGVPKSLLEAAACGRAIIASDVPGCREVVDQGVNGYIIPPYDAQALADRIAQLASDFAQCQRMGRQSRKIVEGDMSAEAVAAQTEAFYRHCLGEGDAAGRGRAAGRRAA